MLHRNVDAESLLGKENWSFQNFYDMDRFLFNIGSENATFGCDLCCTAVSQYGEKEKVEIGNKKNQKTGVENDI